MFQRPLRQSLRIFGTFTQPTKTSTIYRRFFSSNKMKLLYPTSLALDSAKITGFSPPSLSTPTTSAAPSSPPTISFRGNGPQPDRERESFGTLRDTKVPI
ncbi:hypothetical protein QBC36DRAFT_125242 [Triangularia setosa]|uniref:Uncharacterized protein n=1 Tax=Triangularia setosa TaxID=2587417 RepID=A0AAN7A0F0_9PEZI|nr:hypothetical protein QBC36DRAFT_125242 [Podospora setosa]